MDLWFSDFHQDNVKLSINVEREVYSEHSEYQHIAVLDSKEYGRILALDGELITTEKDESFYSEMVVHVPMNTKSDIKTVLVIGGLDGGVLTELEKYETIETIDVVELDQRAVEVCQEYLPQSKVAFQDERVNLYIQDALKFVRRKENAYDLIIVDSANPFGLNESLFTREFYGNCYNALTENGILISQQANSFYQEDVTAFRHIRDRLQAVFPRNTVYLTSVPSYAAGYLLVGFSSKGIDPKESTQLASRSAISTQYYNDDIHVGAFYLPNYIKEMLTSET
ncbi:spermidine synthase [Streptococcus rupicaprae]|uniref:Polyamine aminopropyltransferase n=1 Tax=Streptococcus rupicaprae TaxID=759619 RepID=A0ABV2FHV7_9STRE